MKLEFLDDISDGGRFTGLATDQLVRLYDFDTLQAAQFRQAIQRTILEARATLDWSALEFIDPINCNLTLRLADAATGITTSDRANFSCDLTVDEYTNMVRLLEPFCMEDSKGHQWLYEMATPIDFLFSPGGTW